jgi:hypothetical protein
MRLQGAVVSIVDFLEPGGYRLGDLSGLRYPPASGSASPRIGDLRSRLGRPPPFLSG